MTQTTVHLEVGRFALRTFNVHSGRLHPIIATNSGRHWEGGVCQARCLLYEDSAFSPLAVFSASYHLQRAILKASLQQDITEEELRSLLRHKAPDKACSCGVYGSLDLDNLRKQYTQSLMFVAVIAAEGKTVIGTRGLRTEYARIVAYWTPWYQWYVRGVARRECPYAKSYKDLNAMLKDYGIPRDEDSDTTPDENVMNWWTA